MAGYGMRRNHLSVLVCHLSGNSDEYSGVREHVIINFANFISKLEIDYYKERPDGYEMTEEEKAYISNDVEIIARAIGFFYENNLNKMTIGSCALNEYKSLINDMKIAAKGRYIQSNHFDFEVAQKYGEYDKYEHTMAILYTKEPSH
mgnify:CR=1 FL=1